MQVDGTGWYLINLALFNFMNNKCMILEVLLINSKYNKCYV